MKEKPTSLFVDMHIDELANFMFLKNVNNAIVELSLGGIENNKDFFFFCLDLFCKGLVLLFGSERSDGVRKVDIETLSEDNFREVQHKMGLAGINVHLDVHVLGDEGTSLIENDMPPDVTHEKNAININDLQMEPDHKDLKDYIFKIKMDKLIYFVHFELVHKVI